MTAIPPPPPSMPIEPPPTGRPVSHRRPRRSWRGRRRRVEVTEPVSRVRRLLERWAVPMVAVAVVAAAVLAVLVYLYVNHRLSTLEQDRASRKRSTDQVLAEVRAELEQAKANNDQLRRALCEVIDGVPPGRPGVDRLRQSLRCGPYVPKRPTATRAGTASSAPTTGSPSSASSVAAASPPRTSARPSISPSPNSTAVPSAAPSRTRPSVRITPIAPICLH
jgi:hypothetical protein